MLLKPSPSTNLLGPQYFDKKTENSWSRLPSGLILKFLKTVIFGLYCEESLIILTSVLKGSEVSGISLGSTSKILDFSLERILKFIVSSSVG